MENNHQRNIGDSGNALHFVPELRRELFKRHLRSGAECDWHSEGQPVIKRLQSRSATYQRLSWLSHF